MCFMACIWVRELLVFIWLLLFMFSHMNPSQLLGIICRKVFKDDISQGSDPELVSYFSEIWLRTVNLLPDSFAYYR